MSEINSQKLVEPVVARVSVWSHTVSRGMIDPKFQNPPVLVDSYAEENGLAVYAGHQVISRCCTTGESQEHVTRLCKCKQDWPLWLRKPKETLPEIQNRVSVAQQKGLMSSKQKSQKITTYICHITNRHKLD